MTRRLLRDAGDSLIRRHRSVAAQVAHGSALSNPMLDTSGFSDEGDHPVRAGRRRLTDRSGQIVAAVPRGRWDRNAHHTHRDSETLISTDAQIVEPKQTFFGRPTKVCLDSFVFAEFYRQTGRTTLANSA